MTDIDMEIDISQPLGSSGLAGDDDLIDYEDDYSHENISTTKRNNAQAQHEDPIDETINDVIHVKPEIHVAREESDARELDPESIELGDVEDLGGDEEGQQDLDYEQDNHGLEAGTFDQSSITVDVQDVNGSSHDDHQSPDSNSHDKNDDDDLGNEQFTNPPEQEDTGAEAFENHEPEDYDKNESYSHGPDLETGGLEGDETAAHNDDDASEEHVRNDKAAEELDAHGDLMDEDETREYPDQPHENHGEEISDSGRLEPHDLDDEITWEDEGETHAAAVEETDESAQRFVDDEDRTAESEHTQQSPAQHEDLESTAEETEVAETQHSIQEAAMDQDQLDTEHEATENEKSDFPAVTVQYKGEEFPLFSVASEGFFAEISILDDTIEGLLASFRSELSDELSEGDDLIFQIDELGLEYAESHPHDVLCTCTLRQILEIFDMLVKNQDPDGTRTLYTYLFTKPNPPKRWEALLESAASGHGLEEIMHIFNPRIPTSTEPEAWGGSEEYELLDEYESVEDERGEPAYEDTEEQNRDEIDIAEADRIPEEEDDLGSATGSVNRQEAEEPDHVTNNNDELEESPNTNKSEQPHPEQPANEETVAEVSISNIESDSNINAILDIDVNGQDEEVDFELVDDVPAESQPIGEGEIGQDLSGSTTTSTLHADDPDHQHVAPLEDQTPQNENDDEYQVDLAEIDWNEADENEVATGGESTNTSTKRSYPNDPQEADENSDAKRRRS